jgi:hypothetical protein
VTDENTWARVGRALLGRWPSQVAQWGKSGIAAYVEELQADGLSPEQALAALRQHRPDDGKDYPPSVAQVRGLALQDPERPSADELIVQLYGPGGVFGFKRSNVTVSPWVTAFVDYHGRERLRFAPIDDPDAGKWAVKRIQESWQSFLQVNDGRTVAEIAQRSARGIPTRLDPYAAIGGSRPELESGE